MNTKKHLLLITDAWFPQVNGVVRTLNEVTTRIKNKGNEVTVISPDKFRTIPCPTYPEIRLAVNAWYKMDKMITSLNPNHIHIATEGPLGIAGRKVCIKRNLAFTTSSHTKFPEYIEKRFRVPVKWTYRIMRKFHSPSKALMVATPNLQRELQSYGFNNVVLWSRGVDTNLFNPNYKNIFDYKRPIWLYVGRVAVEKSLEAFLELELTGTKIVIGDGPILQKLKKKFPDTHFLGKKEETDLATHFASADVFVFPSRTDTFGLVMLEALASGLPVAAYPVTGPLDVLKSQKVGVMDNDLKTACLQALHLKKQDCREYAMNYSWDSCAELFFSYLHEAKSG